MIFRSIFFCVLKNKISWMITWKSGVKLRLIITDTVESSKNFGIAERASVVEKLFRKKTRKTSAFRKLLYHVLWYIPKGSSSINFEKFPLNGNCSLSVYRLQQSTGCNEKFPLNGNCSLSVYSLSVYRLQPCSAY